MVLTLKLGGNIGGMWNNQLSTASMTSVPSHSEMLLFFFGYPKVSEHVAFLCFFSAMFRLPIHLQYKLYTRTTLL